MTEQLGNVTTLRTQIKRDELLQIPSATPCEVNCRGKILIESEGST